MTELVLYLYISTAVSLMSRPTSGAAHIEDFIIECGNDSAQSSKSLQLEEVQRERDRLLHHVLDYRSSAVLE